MLYPVLMLTTVWRTILVRVRPNVLLVFNSYADDGVDPSSPNDNHTFISRFKSSWKEDHSLFSWADKGQWETAPTGDRQTSREGDWFRIGFEPVFVDYTKSGTWFVVISLVEVSFMNKVGTSLTAKNSSRTSVSLTYRGVRCLASCGHLLLRQFG